MPLSYLCASVTHGACYCLLSMDQLVLLLLDNKHKVPSAGAGQHRYLPEPFHLQTHKQRIPFANPLGNRKPRWQSTVTSGGIALWSAPLFTPSQQREVRQSCDNQKARWEEERTEERKEKTEKKFHSPLMTGRRWRYKEAKREALPDRAGQVLCSNVLVLHSKSEHMASPIVWDLQCVHKCFFW